MIRVHFSLIYVLSITIVCLQLSNTALSDKYQNVTEDHELYSQKDDIEILTIENFKNAIVGSKQAWLVEYYSRWCGACIELAASRKEFASDVRGWRDLIVIAAVDCSNEINYPLCRDYKIIAYPSVRYYQEGFREEPENYGFTMSWGRTANKYRQDLVSKMISEQSEGRGKHFPNLLPYNDSDTNSIFDEVSADVKNIVLIILDQESLMGPEIILDLHRAKNVIVKYSFNNNTALVTSLRASSYPALYVIGRDQHLEQLITDSYDRCGFKEALMRHFKIQNEDLSNEQVESGSAMPIKDKPKVDT